MKIAILGTGLMGAALAEAMLNSGYEIIVYNRTIAKTASLVALGATAMKTAAEAIIAADAAVIVLPDAQSVRELLFSDQTRLALRGKKLLNVSTTKPEEIIEIAHEVAANGGTLAEMSIMIGADELRDRQGQFMLGCDDADMVFWASLLSGVTKRIDHAGEVGAASKAEVPILVASMFGVVTAAYAAATAIKLNIPKEISEYYIPLSAPHAEYFLPNLLSRNYDFCMASVDNFSVVSANAISAAKSAGIPTSLLENMEALFTSAAARGLGEKDGSAINEILLDPQGSKE